MRDYLSFGHFQRAVNGAIFLKMNLATLERMNDKFNEKKRYLLCIRISSFLGSMRMLTGEMVYSLL